MNRTLCRMTSSLLFLLTCLIPLALSSCNTTPPPSTHAIITAREDWAKMLHAKQLDAIMNMYTPDAMFMVNGDRYAGHDAVRALTKKAMDSFTSDIHFQSAATVISGDLAYDSADYNETLTGTDGVAVPYTGNYLTVYKLQPDGKWLIAQQIWTQKVSPPQDLTTPAGGR